MIAAMEAPAPSRASRGVGGRPTLALAEALIATSALGGAVGLASRRLDLGVKVENRLPLGSPLLAAAALTAVVAAPMAGAAVCEWRARPEAETASAAAGIALAGWIGVEVLVIRTFSWLQPVFALAGVAVAVAGLRRRRVPSRPGG